MMPRDEKGSHCERNDLRAPVMCLVVAAAHMTTQPIASNRSKTHCWTAYRVCTTGTSCEGERLLITDGVTCWPCYKVFEAKYKQFKLHALKVQLGRNETLHTQFINYKHWMIERVANSLEQGDTLESRRRVLWLAPAQLKHMEIRQMIWTPPASFYVPPQTYMLTNEEPEPELVVIGPGREKLAKTSSKQVWKRTVKIIQQAQKEQLVVDGTDDIQTACIDDRMAALVGTFGQEAEAAVPPHAPPDGSRLQAVTPAKVSPDEQEAIKKASRFKQEPTEDDEELLPERPNAKVAGVKRTIVKRESATARPPNSNAQIRTKAAAKGGRQDRPRRDGCTLLIGAMLQFTKSNETCDRFFGPSWRNTARNWLNYLKDVGDMIASDEDEGILQSMQTTEKQAQAVRKVLMAYQNREAMKEAKLVAIYEEQVH